MSLAEDGATNLKAGTLDIRQSQFEADQRVSARAVFKGDLLVILSLGFIGLTAGFLYLLYYGNDIPAAVAVILVVYFAIAALASSPARFPVRMVIGDRGVDFRSRYRMWDKGFNWDQVVRIIAADSPPGRVYKTHFYMLSIYRHRRISNVLRVYLGEVGFREFEEAAAKKEIRIIYYPPRSPQAK